MPLEDKYTVKKIVDKIADGKKLKEDEEEYFVKRINEYWEDHPDVAYRYPRWKKYIAWIAGYQSYDYNYYTNKLVKVPIKRKRKIVFNRLRSFVKTLLAKLAAEKPHIAGLPATNEDKDAEAARATTNLIDGLKEKINFGRELNYFNLWSIIANRACFRIFWNKDDKGIIDFAPETKEVENPETGEVQEVQTGEKKPVFDEGDICIEAISPFNFRVDPLYAKRERWRWFLYGEEVDAEEVEEEYDLESDSLKKQKDLFGQAYQLEMTDDFTLIAGTPAQSEDKKGRTVVFKEFWTPEIYAFVADDQLLEYGINNMQEIPFVTAEHQLIPIDNYERGFVYNESVIKDLIPVQREYNRQASIISQALERASKLKVLTPLGSILNKKQWSNDYGVFIDYNRNMGEPHQMKLDPVPTDQQAYQANLQTEFGEIANVHPASFGQLPKRASHASGTLLNLMLEQDDAVLDPMVQQIHEAVRQSWRIALKLVRENYTVSRLIRYIGENQEPEILKFKGSDLSGNADIRLVPKSGLPKSKALRIEYLLRLREAGLMQDDKTTLELLEMGNVEKVFESELMHKRVAKRENQAITQNSNVNPKVASQWIYDMEDKRVHLQEHLRLRLSPRFGKLSDNQKQALETHIKQTRKQLQEEQVSKAKKEIAYQRALEGEGSYPPGE